MGLAGCLQSRIPWSALPWRCACGWNMGSGMRLALILAVQVDPVKGATKLVDRFQNKYDGIPLVIKYALHYQSKYQSLL